MSHKIVGAFTDPEPPEFCLKCDSHKPMDRFSVLCRPCKYRLRLEQKLMLKRCLDDNSTQGEN